MQSLGEFGFAGFIENVDNDLNCESDDASPIRRPAVDFAQSSRESPSGRADLDIQRGTT